MKNLALLLLFAFMTSSSGDDNDEHFREWSKHVELEGGLEMEERTMDEAKGLPIDERKEEEILKDLKEGVARALQRSAFETSPNIFNFHRKDDAFSERKPSITGPTIGIPVDINLHHVKDLLEEGMGFSCEDGKEEVSPAAELEGGMLEHFAFGEGRCIPKKGIYHGRVNGIFNKPGSQPQQNPMESKDMDIQHFHHVLDEMLGMPSHGGKECPMGGLGTGPVAYSGIGKARRVRQKSWKNSKGSDVPKKSSCVPLKRLHKTSGVDLKQLSQFLDGIKRFPCYLKASGERKPNDLEMKLFKYCGIGKAYRLAGSSCENNITSVPFNKTSFGTEQNVQHRMDLDFGEVNDLFHEALKFFVKMGKSSGANDQDVQDLLYAFCGFTKFRRLSLNSVPHRKVNDASQKTSCNPLDNTEEPKKRKVLHQLGLFLDEMMGFNCEESGEEEMVENTEISGLYEYCGISKPHILPEGFLVNRNPNKFNQTAFCSTPQSLKDPMDLSLKQVSDILAEAMGIPKAGVISEMGEGLYLICTLVKLHVLSEPLDFHQCPSDFHKENF